MVTNTELRYRTLDELVDSIRIDLKAFSSDGNIEIQELIKIVQACNYELGLGITQTKETILEIEHNRAKLPNDFRFLNFALLCHQYRVVQPTPNSGNMTVEHIIPVPSPNLTTCPCWTVVNTQQQEVQTKYIDCSGMLQGLTVPAGATIKLCAASIENITQQGSSQGSGSTVGSCTTVVNNEPTPQEVIVTYFDGTISQVIVDPNSTTCYCAQSVSYPGAGDVTVSAVGECYSNTDTWCCSPSNILDISTSSFCYNDPETATFTCDIPQNCGCNTPAINSCDVVNADPWHQNKVYTICDNTIGIKVMQICSNECREYEYFSPVYMTPCRYASAFMNPERNSMNAPNQAMLKDGFMQFAINCGTVYINYQGLLEDDEGNLLVLDHPRINLYYEWALKKTVIENLYINGEPDLERRLQYVTTEYQKAKIAAITIANTPDLRVMKETMQMIRRNSAQRFSAPVSRFYGRFAGLSFVDRWANGRYAE